MLDVFAEIKGSIYPDLIPGIKKPPRIDLGALP
jgi:hypothetical protein